jgi:drug/metabolite transporter (DMT)-like permease
VTGNRERLVLLAFLAEATLAGGNAVGVKFSNRELDPLWGAGLRFFIAALLLSAVVVALRLPLPRGIAAGSAFVYGALNFGAAFGLAYYALVELHAGFGQILLATLPLVTLLLAVVERQERLRVAAVAGAILALAGVVVMSRAPLEEGLPARFLLAAFGSAFCLAQAAILVRRLPAVHPVTMNAVGMGVGAVLLVVLSFLVGESIELPRRSETWLAIGYLVVVGSGVVFVLYVLVLRFWSASRTAFGFVITPIVTVIVSAWLLDEPVGWELVAGGVLVIGGVYVGAIRGPEAGAGAPEAAAAAPAGEAR